MISTSSIQGFGQYRVQGCTSGGAKPTQPTSFSNPTPVDAAPWRALAGVAHVRSYNDTPAAPYATSTTGCAWTILPFVGLMSSLSWTGQPLVLWHCTVVRYSTVPRDKGYRAANLTGKSESSWPRFSRCLARQRPEPSARAQSNACRRTEYRLRWWS